MLLLGIFAISMLIMNAWMLYALLQFQKDILEMFSVLNQENEDIKQKLSMAIRPKKEEKWGNMREAFSPIPPQKVTE